MTVAFASHPKRNRAAIGRFQVAIPGQRPQREKSRIAVRAQTKDARKTPRGEPRLGPKPVAVLGFGEISDAARHRRMVAAMNRHQPEQGPGGLRCSTRRGLVAAITEFIAGSILAPSAVGILNADQPVGAGPYRGGVRLKAGGIEGAQYRPGAIDIVHAPAAVPAPVSELGIAQIID